MNKNSFSIEFFPPKQNKSLVDFKQMRDAFASLNPEFFSVTYGAGGSSQDRTMSTIAGIVSETTVPVAAHLTCVGSTQDNITQLLRQYQKMGVHRIVALRGDLPQEKQEPGEFKYASDLVEFMRVNFGDLFHIEVAAYPEMHPQAPNYKDSIDYFKAKVDAGANSAITQYFYNIDAYLYFVDSLQKHGIDIPVIAGIMPITNLQQLQRFSDAVGAEIPRWLTKRLLDFQQDPIGMQSFAEEFIIDMCQRLLEQGAPGLHFYCMNQLQPTTRIWQQIVV